MDVCRWNRTSSPSQFHWAGKHERASLNIIDCFVFVWRRKTKKLHLFEQPTNKDSHRYFFTLINDHSGTSQNFVLFRLFLTCSLVCRNRRRDGGLALGRHSKKKKKKRQLFFFFFWCGASYAVVNGQKFTSNHIWIRNQRCQLHIELVSWVAASLPKLCCSNQWFFFLIELQTIEILIHFSKFAATFDT